jgi:hypothetical protein
MAENHAEHDNKKKVKQMERVQKILDLGISQAADVLFFGNRVVH